MRLLIPLAAVLLVGCGYVGDPLPPALNIPARVTDLAVVQRGDKLVIRFTAPSLTTEDLGIRSFGSVDLRVGAAAQPVSMETWESTATTLPVTAPQPGAPVVLETPAAPWRNREVLIAVRLVSTRGREADWSNPVSLTPRAPVPGPAVSAGSHPDGVQIRWEPAPGAKYRITRQAEGEKEAAAIATVDQPAYVDKAVDLGKTYTYVVQAFDGLVESESSAPARVTVRDEFAPKAPSGVTAVAGLNSVELAWDRNTEADLGGYRVYRAEAGNSFTVLADALEAVAYGDRQVEAGKTYRYRITALDKSGNESEPSAPVQAAIAQ